MLYGLATLQHSHFDFDFDAIPEFNLSFVSVAMQLQSMHATVTSFTTARLDRRSNHILRRRWGVISPFYTCVWLYSTYEPAYILLALEV